VTVTNDNDYRQCSGVLVDLETVITVKNCTFNGTTRVRAGSMGDSSNENPQIRNMTLQPSSTKLAVYKTSEPFQYTDFVRPICLGEKFSPKRLRRGFMLYTNHDENYPLVYQTAERKRCHDGKINCLANVPCLEHNSTDIGSPVIAKVDNKMTLIGLRTPCARSIATYTLVEKIAVAKIQALTQKPSTET